MNLNPAIVHAKARRMGRKAESWAGWSSHPPGGLENADKALKDLRELRELGGFACELLFLG
jgi:hypothetical protein